MFVLLLEKGPVQVVEGAHGLDGVSGRSTGVPDDVGIVCDAFCDLLVHLLDFDFGRLEFLFGRLGFYLSLLSFSDSDVIKDSGIFRILNRIQDG